ncbi:MAG: T9SS type A sorting domain-containing protein, partial [Saprospiraceae bacterium]|nr:T9SS type A sorting domain-containing protein [Saprospiraceae bacterium]
LYQVQIIPNPSTAYADLIFESELKDARFELFDKSGRLIRTEQFSGNRYRLERNGLRPGIYTFRVGGFAGKVAITD